MAPSHAPLDEAERQSYSLSRLAYVCIAAALLAILACELFFSTRQQSQAFDESAHLFAGFEYWKHADFGVNPEHPPLVKLVAASPLLTLPLKEPQIPPIPYFKAQNFIGGAGFVYSADADSLLMRGRMAVAIFALGLAFLVLACTHEMFGQQTALLALGLLAFEPVLLANGALVTTDMGVACLFFAAAYAFYRYVKKPSMARLALCAAAAALAIVAKHSGALILSTLALIAVAEVVGNRQEFASDSSSSGESTRKKSLRLAGALLAVALVSYAVLWAFYGFRYAARPSGLQMIPPLAGYMATLKDPLEKAAISFFARHHWFPEAYLYGWVDILQIPGTRPMFLFGKLYSSGRWFFFPAMFLIKSSIALLVLLALAPFAGLWKHRRELIFLVIPPAFFLIASILSSLNLGVRHILPIYPFCIVLAAAAGWHLAARSRAAAVGVAALFLFAVVSSLSAFPNYLAHSNEFFGGPSNTYRVVTDSNADWGQGLKWVKSYLDENHINDCWFDYYNPFVNPAYYGIRCKPLPSALGHYFSSTGAIPPRISGTILIDATETEGFLWGPDVMNPYEQFRNRRPDDVIGHIVLVYRGTFDVPLLAAMSHAGTAFTLLNQRKVAEALAESQAAAQQAPQSAEIQAIAGQILMTAGRKAEGQQAFAKALRLARAVHPDYQQQLIQQIEHPGP